MSEENIERFLNCEHEYEFIPFPEPVLWCPDCEHKQEGVNSKCYIGIDPGWSGGLAVHTQATFQVPETDGNRLGVEHARRINLFNMPGTTIEIWNLITKLSAKYEQKAALVERVGYHRAGNSASSSVKFGKNVAYVEMALIGNGIIPQWVTPSKWMRFLLDDRVPEDKKERKHEIRDEVDAIYPGVADRITLKTADALGILHYFFAYGDKS